MSRLAGKVAIVSGAGSGMGACHSRVLVEHGAAVLGFDVVDGDGPRLQEELGDRFHFSRGSVTVKADWDRVVAECESRFGPVSVLVNNAGILGTTRVENDSEASYRRVIDVNQIGVFLGMQAVIPSMRRAGVGSMINIGSTSSLVGFTDNFSYCAAKWAVRGMTRAAALELASDNIRVNTVCPSETDTPMLRDSDTPGVAFPPETFAFGRWARPEEISAAVVFLASDEASYISGTDIVVDGTYTAG